MQIKNVVSILLILLVCNVKVAVCEPPAGGADISTKTHGFHPFPLQRPQGKTAGNLEFKQLNLRSEFGIETWFPPAPNADRPSKFSSTTASENPNEDYLASDAEGEIGRASHLKSRDATDKILTRNSALHRMLDCNMDLLDFKRQSEGKHPIEGEYEPIDEGSVTNEIGVSIKVTMLIPEKMKEYGPMVSGRSFSGRPSGPPILDKIYYGDLDQNMETILRDIETAADAEDQRLGPRKDWLPKKRWRLHQRVALADYLVEKKRHEKRERRLRAIIRGEPVPPVVSESHTYRVDMPQNFNSEKEHLMALEKAAAKAWNDGEYRAWALIANVYDLLLEKINKRKAKSALKKSNDGIDREFDETVGAYHAPGERLDQITNAYSEYSHDPVSGVGGLAGIPNKSSKSIPLGNVASLRDDAFAKRAKTWGIPLISYEEARRLGYTE